MAFFPNQTTGSTMYNPTVLNIVGLTNLARPSNSIFGTTTAPTATFSDGVSFTSSEGTLQNPNVGDPYNLFVYGTVFASNFTSLCPLVFTAGKTESMWITEEGKVGIGTPEPTATLHVGGNVLIKGGGIIQGTTLFTDDVEFNGCVNFKGDVHINGRLYINGKEIS